MAYDMPVLMDSCKDGDRAKLSEPKRIEILGTLRASGLKKFTVKTKRASLRIVPKNNVYCSTVCSD